MTPADVADRLHARPTGPGRWMARCPAHADSSPSLSIREGDGGRLLLHCFAGCATANVLRAAGLTWRDICGVPTTPADRARLARDRTTRQAADTAQRRRERARTDALRHADATLASLAAAAMADGGDAAAREYHRLLHATRHAEVPTW